MFIVRLMCLAIIILLIGITDNLALDGVLTKRVKAWLEKHLPKIE